MNYHVPSDRPIIYGLFINYMSLNISLWFVVLAQIIITILTLRYLLVSLDLVKNHWLELLIIILLSFTTSLSYNTGFLIPDIFTPISCILSFVILFGSLTKLERGLLTLLYLVSLMTHLSNVPINILTLLCLLILSIFRFGITSSRYSIQIVILILLNLISLQVLSATHYMYGKSFVISKCPFKFVLARLSEERILKDLLNDKCIQDSDYSRLCPYKNELYLQPSKFLWREDSPFIQIASCNSKNNKEIKKLIYDSFSNPGFVYRFIKGSTVSSMKLLINFGVTRQHFDENSNNNRAIKKYFPDDYNEFVKSRQFNNLINTNHLNMYYSIFLIPYLLIILYLLWFKYPYIDTKIKLAVIYFSLFYISNSIVSAGFSANNSRYSNRVIWIIPLIAIIVLYNYLKNKNSAQISE